MERNIVIDFLKFLFILCIFGGHLNYIALAGENNPILMRLGFLGVEFFFIVSGAFMFYKIKKLNSNHSIQKLVFNYIERKVSIFMPYYLIAFFLGFVLFHYPDSFSLKIMSQHFIQSLPCLLQLEMLGIKGYQVLGPTWFLSAMLVSILLLFPLYYKYRSSCNIYIAVVLAVIIYGYIFYRKGNLATINPIGDGFVYSGVLRGIAGMSMGAICLALSEKINEYEYTKLGAYIISITEIMGYLLIFVLMHISSRIRFDFLILVLMIPCIAITLSKKSYTVMIANYLPNWLGKLSMMMFLCDALVRRLICIVMSSSSRDQKIIPCIILLFLMSGIVWYIGNKFSNLYNFIIKLIIKESSYEMSRSR